MLPPPLVDQVKEGGWLAMATPNWSSKVAPNACVPPTARLTVAGLTRRCVAVWTMRTLTELVVVRPRASSTATVIR